jgi:hypothetical protein
MATHYPATGPFTDASSRSFIDEGRSPQHDNQPPLEERVLLQFEEELEPLKARIQELLESAARCPETIDDEKTAGKASDLIKLARQVEKDVDEAREKHNRPLINARNSLKSRADGAIAQLLKAGGDIRGRLNAFVQREEASRAEERRKEEEARRIAEEAARAALEKEGITTELTEPIFGTTPIVPQRGPVARGDYGSSVSGRQVWKHERQVPIAKLPKNVLENAKVIEAVDQVLASMVRQGAREIKGVRIFATTEATVR